jgi:hypothetical protein
MTKQTKTPYLHHAKVAFCLGISLLCISIFTAPKDKKIDLSSIPANLAYSLFGITGYAYAESKNQKRQERNDKN